MTYEQIDSTINTWVAKHKFVLFTKIEGMHEPEFRAVYISSPLGECCQISIEKPESGQVAIHIAGIETRQDEEISKNWIVPMSELEGTLENAVSFVQNWFRR